MREALLGRPQRHQTEDRAQRELETQAASDHWLLGELSFDHGRRGGQRRWFLASAVYAYGFLSSDAGHSTEALALDSRTRLAADLNRGLTEGLKVDGELRVADGQYPLPFGSLSLDLDEADLSSA